MPFAFVSADTSYWWLGGLLVVRGFGLGSTMMPAMAAAYAVLEGPEVPRATSALNVVQRVGGSMGTAVLAVVLQGQLKTALPGGAGGGGGALGRLPEDVRVRVAEPLAGAFAHTFVWAVVASLVALVPALVLARTHRRRPPSGTPEAASDAAPRVPA